MIIKKEALLGLIKKGAIDPKKGVLRWADASGRDTLITVFLNPQKIKASPYPYAIWYGPAINENKVQ